MATSAPGIDGNPILQVHQSIFTWTGWSLSIKPLFNSINATKPTEDNCAYPPLCHVRPKYSLAQKGQLPPLRFGQSNTFRCRAVDRRAIVSALQLRPTGGRTEESYRGTAGTDRPPHILLNQPLPRVSWPGAQADRMVVRDGAGTSGRTLVAPREPLRMAELHDQLKSATLPPSAFPDAILMPDGSFPNVKTAEESGLLPSEPEGNKNGDWSDALFLHKENADPPDCPFYPDRSCATCC